MHCNKQIYMKKLITLCVLGLGIGSGFSQNISLDSTAYNQLKSEIKEELKAEMVQATPSEKRSAFDLSRFSLKGYGAVNYYSYDYDTDNNLRNKMDAERLNMYLGYKFTPKITLKAEIEFEHGGTGATMELDTQEEFGEFEQEIEDGGEVKLEQLNLAFDIHPKFNARVGRMKIYFGLAQNLDAPTQYFTTHRQEMENELLPLGWYENGIELYGKFFNNRLRYRVFVTNGLDASGFSSRGWIKGGHQTRFEMVNANGLAYTARLDYKFGTHKDTFVGITGYIGNTSPNRPKEDMLQDAYLTMAEAHITYNEKNLRFAGMIMYGALQNSHLISRYNASLPNTLGVKRNPVGHTALGAEFEIGYNILPLWKPNSKQRLYPFARLDYYDSMFSTEGTVVDKPRWERTGYTTGVNWFVHPQIVFKAHYQTRILGSQHLDPGTLTSNGKRQRENTFSAGVGFKF